jgi:drug/metabolite transporter (DMT)-like permease/biotin carboxylase
MRPFFAIGLTILASLSSALVYAFYKALLPFFPNSSALCIQSFFSWLLITPFALRGSLKSQKLGLICIRSLFGLGAMYCVTLALITTSLAEVSLLNNTAPLFVPFITWMWLKEKIKYNLWPSLLLGFIGVVIILRPTAAEINQGLFVALLSGVLAACLVVVVRQIAHEPLPRILFYYFLLFWVILSPFMLFSWREPPLFVWLYLLAAAILMITGQLSLTAALRHASPQIIAPFLYTFVLFSGLIGWVVWNETPHLIPVIGMVLVTISCVITMLLNQKKSMDAIILVEPVASGALFKQTIRSMGYKVVCVFSYSDINYEKHLHSSKETRIQDCDLIVPSADVQDIIRQLKNSIYEIKGCIAGSEGGVELTARLATALGLISTPVELASSLRDKGLMRQTLKKSGLSCPDFKICVSEKEVDQFAKEHSFPMIVKTPQGAGTSQVYVCANRDQLFKNFHEVLQTKNRYDKVTMNAVVEEYIGGKEYIVDTFSDGRKIHVSDVWCYDKISSETFSNIYYNIITVPLTDPSIRKLMNYGIQVATVFGIKRGPAHIEIKDDPKRGPTLIEIAGRLAGANLPGLICKYCNFDIYRATIEVFTAGSTIVPEPITYTKHAAVCFCPVLKTGVIKKILGIEQIQKFPSYQYHKISIHPGDQIQPSTALGTIPCSVYLAHADREQLLHDVAQVHNLFEVLCV